MTTSHSRIVNSLLFFSGLGVALPALFLYWLTGYPTVAYIDSGELAVVNWTLGIAHPTGYPLYTLIGRLFALLPFELIKTQILFGTLCTTTTVIVMFLLSYRLRCNNTDHDDDNVGAWRAVPALSLLCTILGLLLAVSPLLWEQGVTNEVYSLHLVFISLLLYVVLQPYSDRYLILGGYLLGLSFGNHMSTILLIPTSVAYLLVNRRAILRSPKATFLAAIAGLCGASVYLYLPIRSSLDPTFNWGHPSTWESFIRHVSGWQYQVWMFNRSFDQLGLQFLRFVKILFAQFPIPFWLFIAIGLAQGLKRHRAVSLYLLLLLFCNLIYSLNFSIPDIDNYLLPSVVVLFLFGATGTLWLASLKPIASRLVTGFVAILIIWGTISNWVTCDESDNYSALDGVHNYYKSVEKNALILSADWDFVSPWLYSHFYLRERPDITLVDPELTRRSWYPDLIRHTDPALFDHIKLQVDDFLPHVQEFEREKPYDSRAIESTYRAILFKLATHPQRPVYLSAQDAGISQQLTASGLTPSISGQLFRVLSPAAVFAAPTEPIYQPRFGKHSEYLDARDRMHLDDFNWMQQLDSTHAVQNSAPQK